MSAWYKNFNYCTYIYKKCVCNLTMAKLHKPVLELTKEPMTWRHKGLLVFETLILNSVYLCLRKAWQSNECSICILLWYLGCCVVLNHLNPTNYAKGFYILKEQGSTRVSFWPMVTKKEISVQTLRWRISNIFCCAFLDLILPPPPLQLLASFGRISGLVPNRGPGPPCPRQCKAYI